MIESRDVCDVISGENNTMFHPNANAKFMQLLLQSQQFEVGRVKQLPGRCRDDADPI